MGLEGGGKWGERGREMVKGGGKWGFGTPLSTPQVTDVGRVRKNLAIHCQFRLAYSNLGKTAEVRFNRAEQLNRRRHRRPALYG